VIDHNLSWQWWEALCYRLIFFLEVQAVKNDGAELEGGWGVKGRVYKSLVSSKHAEAGKGKKVSYFIKTF
jgi:hypothetical protein